MIHFSMATPTHCVIFLPGIKGSQFANNQGQLIWPNVCRAQFQNMSLSYHLPDLGIHNDASYQAAGIVRSVPILPSVWQQDIYGDFLEKLQVKFSSQTQVITFAYDWRDHLFNNVCKLADLILELKNKGVKKIDLIGHSMGGLIVAYLLRYGKNIASENDQEWLFANYLDKICFVTVPFNGTIKSLYDLHHGIKIGFNRSLLSPKALCTFPSIYYLLAHYNHAVALVENDQFVEQSLYDVNLWQRYQLSYLMNASDSQSMRSARFDYLHNCLTSAKNFHESLQKQSVQSPSAKVEIASITSDALETQSRLQIDVASKQFNWINTPGDGSIPQCSAQLPAAFSHFKTRHYQLEAEHVAIFQTKECQDILYHELDR